VVDTVEVGDADGVGDAVSVGVADGVGDADIVWLGWADADGITTLTAGGPWLGVDRTRW